MAKTDPTGLQAFKPAEIAALVEASGVAKARLPFLRMFTLAVLDGAFIALGAAAYTMTMTGAIDVSTPKGIPVAPRRAIVQTSDAAMASARAPRASP